MDCYRTAGVVLALILLSVGSAQAQTYSYSSECTSKSGSVLIEDYGTITTGAAADSLQRVENLNAIESAISSAPQGGAVCLPGGEGTSQDSVYVTFNETPGGQVGHIDIERDRISLIGAGACGWGDMSGCSYIGTPGDRGSYYFRGDDDNDGTDEVYRGSGINYIVSATAQDSARSLTLKGFEINGQTQHNGNYSFNYNNEAPEAENGWDLSHKGIDFSGGGDPMTDIVVEDVKVKGFRGEMIYNGGFEMGVIRFRRVWAHESNASTYNIAQAAFQKVTDSKFGPNVRFWGELQAEGIPNATAIYKRNEYVDCGTGNGCIAIAADTESNYVDGMSWTWENNDFNIDPSNSTKRHFLIRSADYKLNIKNNDFTGGQIWIANSGAGSGYSVDLEMTGNTHNEAGDVFLFQGARIGGVVAENTFTNEDAIFASVGGDLSQLVITRNTYDDQAKINFGGSGASVNPLLVDNTYLNPTLGTQKNFFSDGSTNAYVPRLQLNGGSGGTYNGQLDTEASDRQRVKLYGRNGTVWLRADSSEHNWSTDKSLSGSSDSLTIQFDRSNMKWKETAVRKQDLLNERGGWSSGSANADTIRGSSSFDGSSSDSGYFRFERITNTPAATDSFAVDTQIDSVDAGVSNPFAHAVLRASADTLTSSDRVNFECARFGYCRVTWRKGGDLNKGNWQRQSLPVYARIVRDGDSLTVQTRESAADPWTGVPLDQDGFQASDDKLHIPLGADPYVGAGVKSGDSQESMTAVLDPLVIVTPN
jgi:hypothetical protein